ncbi:MAG: Fur family transcriptional regulator [Planctomycetota bacterium]
MTRQRRVILEEARRASGHPTVDEVYRRVRERLPRISLGTVYRNLGRMGERGLLSEIRVAGEQKRYEGDVSPHQHLRCTRCGRLEDVRVELPDELSDPPERMDGFSVERCEIQFLGVCPECRA